MIKTKKKSIIGIGIDQGLANCGYSVVELFENDTMKVLESGTFLTKSTYPLPQRIEILFSEINGLVSSYPVQMIGCEKLFFNQYQKTEKGGVRNKSASIVSTNMVTGIIYLIAGQQKIPLKEFVPGTVKKLVAGHGRATKEALEEAIINIMKNGSNSTEKPFGTSHESDATGIGIATVKYFRENKEEVLEKNKQIKPRKKKGVK